MLCFPRCPRKICCLLPFGDVYSLPVCILPHLGRIWDVYPYPWEEWFGNSTGCCAGFHFGWLYHDSLFLFCKKNFLNFLFHFLYKYVMSLGYTSFCGVMLLLLYWDTLKQKKWLMAMHIVGLVWWENVEWGFCHFYFCLLILPNSLIIPLLK